MKRWKQLWHLFFVFCQIGVTTFGGGYAMLPILQREIVEKRHWATEDELMDYYAIGQCTPGVIAVNTATFIGYRLCGTIGGVTATFGVVFPSIVIITLITIFLTNFASLPVVAHAFNGIRACVTVLIFDSVIKLGRKSVKDHICLIIFLAVLGFSLFTNISTVLLIILAGVAGLLVCPDFRKKPAAAAGAGAEKEQDKEEKS